MDPRAIWKIYNDDNQTKSRMKLHGCQVDIKTKTFFHLAVAILVRNLNKKCNSWLHNHNPGIIRITRMK